MKQRLYMVHCQGRYGENVYVPFSVGCLWAYARTFPEIDAAYEMVDFLYLKEPIERAVARLESPDIVAISHYVWNAKWNEAFAREVKRAWPCCTIIVGGVQVHDESPRTLEECEAFDFAIYGEGEGAFADFLRAYKDGLRFDYSECGSLIWRWPLQTWKKPRSEQISVNARRDFVPLEQLRSPYLDGVFDAIWDREPRWQILQETSRGCPYACTFCAWGQAALTELRPFPEERVRAEIDWFGQRGVDYIDNADANYGIVKRDVEMTRHLAATKAKYGYPRTFRTSFAKNSNETIWEIANVLHEAKMLKSVTLAMQSMDDEVLVNIKRKNIKFNKFEQLIKRYEDAGIPTYTEIILGLPGESLDTFLDGIDKNLEAGQHSGLFTYLNIMLNNTEQNTPEYRAAHGLETRELQAMLTHGTPDDTVIRESQEVVVGTSAMPHEDWKRAYLHGKVVEIFHAQGLLQDVAIKLHERGVRYRDFYGKFLDWCLGYQLQPKAATLCGTPPRPTRTQRMPPVGAREVLEIRDLLDRALAGGSWDCVDPRLGDISWPPEEFAFARICLDLDLFYRQTSVFLMSQAYRGEWEISFEEINDFMRNGGGIAKPPADTVVWAREVIWYGRKGSHALLKKRRAS